MPTSHGMVTIAIIAVLFSGAEGYGTAGSVDDLLKKEDGEQIDCVHGEYNNDTKTCDCFDNWGTAGITDTVDFLEGVCEQYHCVDDKTCQDVLGIPGASCPVEGWNCLCSWSWSLKNNLHGYETPHKRGGAECMGFMYTLSLNMTEDLMYYMSHAWKLFAILALVALPFGRKRSNCDHHVPSMMLWFRSAFCGPPQCPGNCASPESYNWDVFTDDLAWSIFFVELGVWTYLFLSLLYLLAMFVWSVVLWTLVILITIVIICGTICAGALGLGGGGGDAACCAGDCLVGDCTCTGCGDCCFMASGGGAHAGPVDAFYWGGYTPYDPFWGYSGYGSVGTYGGSGSDPCCDGNCRCLLWPIALMCRVFPRMPENLWGGLVGFLMGTHTFATWTYQGGNCVVEFMRMGWLRRGDLHDSREGYNHNDWREQVHRFLMSDPPHNMPYDDELLAGYSHESSLYQRGSGVSMASSTYSGVTDPGFIRIGTARVFRKDACFTEEDTTYQSALEDYQRNVCWICCTSNDEWDLWMSCKHLFCKDCSTTMLQRRMPCPLCRVSSSTVLRGSAYGRYG